MLICSAYDDDERVVGESWPLLPPIGFWPGAARCFLPVDLGWAAVEPGAVEAGGTCPAVFCIWPVRSWIWMSGDPAVCGLCSAYRDRGSPLPCVDHDDDGDCDGASCEGGQ